MRLAYLVIMLGFSSLGCSHLGKSECKHCHGEDGDEEITVHAKPQKVIVESVTAAPQSAPGATPQSSPVPAAPMVNQQMMAQPMMMPMNMMQTQPTNVRVRERTGLGITMDKIDISIPFPRLIAVQKPTEVTYQMPHVPMMGTPMQMSMMGMGMPMMQPGMPIIQPGMPMMAQMPHPSMQMAPMQMATQLANGLTQQQILQLAQALQQQQSAPSAQQQSASSNLMDDKELDELQKKCDQLKKLREQRDALRKQAGGG